MNVIRWILSNIILILFVLALTYAYVYWDNLTGEDTPAGQVIAWLSDEFDTVRDFVEEMREDETVTPTQADADTRTAETSAQTAETGEPAAETDESAAEKFARADAVRSVSQPVQEVQKTSQQVAQETSREASSSGQGQPGSSGTAHASGMTSTGSGEQAEPRKPDAPQVSQPARQQQPADSPSAQTSQGSANDGQAGGAAASKQTSSASDDSATTETQPSVRELWIDARNAYLDGDYEASIRNYRQVIERSEDNYDALGELGNVYYRQRNYEEAADAYFGAAEILVKLGQARRASTLRPILSRLNREKSRQLEELLQSSR